MKYIEVFVKHRLNTDTTVIYSVKPSELISITIGQFVEVPFRNKKIIAIVVGFSKQKVDYKVRNIIRIISGKIYNNVLFKTANFMLTQNYSPVSKNLFSFIGAIPNKIKGNEIYDVVDKVEKYVKIKYFFSNDKKRINYYKNLIKNRKKIIFSFATIKRAQEFAKIIGYKHRIYSNRLTPSQRYKLQKAFAIKEEYIIIGSRHSIFLQSAIDHMVVVDGYNHLGHKNDSHPNYYSEDVVNVFSKFGIEVLLFSTSPTLSSVNEKWNYLIDKQPKILIKLYSKIDDINYFLETLVENKNKILVYNPIYRSSSIFCNNCNEFIKCENCWKNLTGIKDNGLFYCKYCLLNLVDNICNVCKQNNLKLIRFGLEDNIQLVKNITRNYSEISSFNLGNINDQCLITLATSKIFDLLNPSFDRVVLLNFDFLSSSKNFNFDEETIAIISNLKQMAKNELVIVTKDETSEFFKIKSQQDLKYFFNNALGKRKHYKLKPFYTTIDLIAQNINPFILKTEKEKIKSGLLKISSIDINEFSENIYNSKSKFWQSYIRIKIKFDEVEKIKKKVRSILFKLPNKWRYKVS